MDVTRSPKALAKTFNAWKKSRTENFFYLIFDISCSVIKHFCQRQQKCILAKRIYAYIIHTYKQSSFYVSNSHVPRTKYLLLCFVHWERLNIIKIYRLNVDRDFHITTMNDCWNGNVHSVFTFPRRFSFLLLHQRVCFICVWIMQRLKNL